MTKTLHYVFDPLCGWCYGAAAAVAALGEAPEVELRLLPSGLFSGAGARPMDDDFAAYAWSNDQRIERLTGQRFSERYRSQVLSDRKQRFDSGPATLALSAVSLTAPERELEALEAIQHARYVNGEDITRPEPLTAVLQARGLEQAAACLLRSDGELLAVNRARIEGAKALQSQLGARGVPSFILETHGQRQLLNSSAAYANPQAFAEQIAKA
ncbi:protein-disulfide isomerase [Comamonas testosteroni TK102]|uniref:Protein-disulfide isomerase n=1 Tax=Comamonas testosteroni TK102 TaxID=1392005 RepID=A0A076PQL3_COMTE|nr:MULTISPECIES: DsbA family protein [Comamonas]AIJ45657.1 protein-disulfide isomerase [Comamonas testosteroni TK102]MPS87348.1 DsbA family protein [Comamonas sp.]